MGDKISNAIDGTLRFVPLGEFQRIREIAGNKEKNAQVFADMARLNTLYMIANAGSGHIGSSFSSLDIVTWLLFDELQPSGSILSPYGDIYFSSKGHDAPGYYSALIGMGRIEFNLLHKLRRLNGLPGHPDIRTPEIVTNTGSLGMGISKAKGMAVADRLLGRKRRIFVMTGDGELQEGQFWESLGSATNNRLHEITVIIDHNKMQSDTFVHRVSDLGDLEVKLCAFGWHVERVNGNDMDEVSHVLRNLRDNVHQPKIVIADTIKGCGVSFMEHTAFASENALYPYHSGAPSVSDYNLAVEELTDKINTGLELLKVESVTLESVTRQRSIDLNQSKQNLITAYSEALVDQASKCPNLVVLDADLAVDTGLMPFCQKFPDRFIECGIAEQDMVSQAGGMALNGLLPVVHSFASFLSSRPNEQIYNNATEDTKIIYVGSLAGILPGGPGHSHQSVRDISLLSNIPGLTLIEPCTEDEVYKAVDWCVNRNDGSSYIRLGSVPWSVPFELPVDYKFEEGRGCVLTEGSDAALIACGPILLSQGYEAAEYLARINIGLKVINLPWLNKINIDWLKTVLSEIPLLITLDNHYLTGGQGYYLNQNLINLIDNLTVRNLGLDSFPVCGTDRELLGVHKLNVEAITDHVVSTID